MSQPVSDYTFIAIGKTGVGKSSTCNMIVGKPRFFECDSGTSVTYAPQEAQSDFLGYQVTVIDTPGVMDTSVNSHEAKKRSCNEMIEAMSHCPAQGKRALVLVLKFGDRYTEESRESLYILENIFGEEFLKKCCIIVMTHGELFDMNYEEENLNFEEWCKQQGGDLKQLFETCSYRCLLFRNRSRDPDVRRQQIENLIKLTDTLDESYTDEKFAIARRRHKRLILESELPSVLAEYDLRLSELHQEVNSRIVQDQSLNELLSLEHRTKQIVTELEDEDKEIFYTEGELSLFNMQKLRAEDIRKQIHSQFIAKLKLELTTRLTDLKFIVVSCESESIVDIYEEKKKEILNDYATMGLIFKENENLLSSQREDGQNFETGMIFEKNYDISVTKENLRSLQKEDGQTFEVGRILEKKYDISIEVEPRLILQKEDGQYFEGLKDLLHKFEDVLVEKRQELGTKRQQKEIEQEIRELRRKLNSIPRSEKSSERAKETKKKAEELLKEKENIFKKEQSKCLEQQVKDIVENAEDKIKDCNTNKFNAIVEGVSDIAGISLGGIGVVASASKHVVAKVVTKAALPATSFLKSVGGLIKNLRN